MRFISLAALCVLAACSIQAQTFLYQQNFDGVPAPALPPAWVSTTPTTQTIANTASNYAGASGAQNLFLANCQPPGQERSVTISGISTLNYSEITLQFGHRRTAFFDIPVTLEWSLDGSYWTGVNYVVPSTPSEWEFYTSEILPADVEDQPDLKVRWTWTTNNNNGCSTAVPNYRIDDFAVVAVTSLPVTLTHFSASLKDEKGEITFSTASEHQSDRFEVERSENGYQFTTLGVLPAAGESTEPQSYYFTDEMPVRGTGYYRLKEVDLDGRFSYSKVISLKSDAASDLLLYPCPVKEYFYVQSSISGMEESTWEVVDISGRIMNTGIQPPGQDIVTISTVSLPSALYFFRKNTGTNVLHKQFLKL